MASHNGIEVEDGCCPEGRTRLTIELDKDVADRVKSRLTIVDRIPDADASEVVGDYLRYGMLYHEEAVYDDT